MSTAVFAEDGENIQVVRLPDAAGRKPDNLGHAGAHVGATAELERSGSPKKRKGACTGTLPRLWAARGQFATTSIDQLSSVPVSMFAWSETTSCQSPASAWP